MSRDELRAAYSRVSDALNLLRDIQRAVYAGDPDEAKWVGQVDRALDDLRLLGEAVRMELQPEQPALLDMPKRGGY